MNKIYIIKKISENNIPVDSPLWETADIAFVNNFAWDENGFRPHTEVRALYGDKGITIKYCTNEIPSEAKYKNFGESTYRDSCMEFFIKPDPEKSANYINFEINSISTLYVGFGSCRNDSKPIKNVSTDIFDIVTMTDDEGWILKYYIPFEFLEKCIGSVSKNMMGNFYKCGDETPTPHYGTWAPVENNTPDFHRPECFGEIILE